jgi:hypothetical protein
VPAAIAPFSADGKRSLACIEYRFRPLSLLQSVCVFHDLPALQEIQSRFLCCTRGAWRSKICLMGALKDSFCRAGRDRLRRVSRL